MIEQALKKRQVPSFFSGNLEKWQESKSAILNEILSKEYGFLPKKITPSIKTEINPINFAGKAKWEIVYFTFENEGKSHTVEANLILPIKEKTDVFLYLSFESHVPNKYLPVEEIIDEGFGIFTFGYQDVSYDKNEYESGLCALFSGDYGKLSLWAYMAHACTDYLCQREDIGKIAIVGHSRLGKTAILASALDDRYVLTCTNDSGCCGAALSRGKTKDNEDIETIVNVFPHWFCNDFSAYKGAEENLPFDQHLLLAQIAPRHLMIGTANEDVWADNEGQFLSAYLASDIWKLYGKKGLVCKNELPSLGTMLTDGEIGFYQRQGSHFMSRDDWKIYMAKYKEILNEISK